MKRLKILFASFAVACCLMPVLSVTAATDVFKGACESAGGQSSTACTTKTTSNPLTGPNGTITRATRLISYITGVAAIIMITVGGLMYILSDGDASKISSARTTILYALIGLVIVATAQGIVVFVLSRI